MAEYVSESAFLCRLNHAPWYRWYRKEKLTRYSVGGVSTGSRGLTSRSSLWLVGDGICVEREAWLGSADSFWISATVVPGNIRTRSKGVRSKYRRKSLS